MYGLEPDRRILELKVRFSIFRGLGNMSLNGSIVQHFKVRLVVTTGLSMLILEESRVVCSIIQAEEPILASDFWKPLAVSKSPGIH